MTTAEGSPSQDELVTKQMMPLPVCSAMRRSAMRKKRMYRSSSLFLVMSQFSARPDLVRLGEAAFFAAGYAGEAVVGRVAEHDEDGLARA